MAQLNFTAAPAPTPAPVSARTWSPYQEAIFSFVENESGNAIVEAVAGSGKSTTIIECLRRLPQGQSSIFLAFNKSIADELKARGVNARTFHSLTYMPVTQHKHTRSVDSDKLRRVANALFSQDDGMLYGTFACKMVGLARNAGIGCLVKDVPHAWYSLANHFDIELENENADFTRGIELSRELLVESNRSDMVDFDDLLYLAVKDGLSLPKFDFVFVDEAQDTNAIQRAILRKILKPGARIVAVGDPAQAIYGFRGANANSLDLIADEFNCARLPLTVSYRCPTAVVEYARQWVSHIEPAPEAPEGLVEDKGLEWKLEDFAPSDLVLCRTTAPIITLGYRLLKAQVPVTILGREIGAGLVTLIKKLGARDIEGLEAKLQTWETREVEKCIAKQQEGKQEAIMDKASAIVCLIDSLPEDNRTINALIDVIGRLFSPSTKAVTLCTIHKAKGLEAKHVYWLNASKCPSRWARQAWQKQQELNLCYVATTRAMSHLTIIEDGSK